MSERRQAIRDALAASEKGWMYTTELATLLDIDRSTVYHHASKMVEQGVVAMGTVRRLGEPGRPVACVIDIARIHDLEHRFTETVPHPSIPTASPLEYECEITVTAAPDEWDRNPAAMGPVSRALRDGALTDRLAAAIVQTVSHAILTDLRKGRTRLVIEAVEPELLDTPSNESET